MFRTSLAKALAVSSRNGGRFIVNVRATATTPAKAPEKIEVFVDDQSVWVEPGTTVLQVEIKFENHQCLLYSRPAPYEMNCE